MKHPIGIDKLAPIITDNAVNSIVGHAFIYISDITGLPVQIDVPKSPLKILIIQIKYCSRIDLSNPNLDLNSFMPS